MLLTMVAAACADPGGGPEPTPAADGSAEPAGTRSAPGEEPLDLHRPGDMGFYTAFKMDDAHSAARFRDLDEGTRASTVVAVARVVDVVAISGQQGEVGVVLRPTDVVAGALPPAGGDRLTVVFVVAASDDEQIAMLRRRLPAQPGLWFLRVDNETLRPVSPQGLFVQGSQGVETPLTSEGDGDMAAEGRDYRRLSALVRQVRGVR
ncbi:hypothetical protein [Asanoa sp. NPDC050611]|uniref:hypothetical protein n=1 Tax=Asanoa sp. NPDC050611 TaxID=3157098 RepID=UPI00340448DF